MARSWARSLPIWVPLGELGNLDTGVPRMPLLTQGIPRVRGQGQGPGSSLVAVFHTR